MPLTRSKKAEIIDEVSEKLENSPIIYLTNPIGLSVSESNELRGRFFEAGVEFTVVKNTLARLAMQRVGGLEELEEHLQGPTAIAFSEKPAAPARAMQDFLEDTEAERPALKAAYVDGDFYGADELEMLASLKSREELIGEILSLLQAPITNIVGGLQAQGETLAGAVKTLAASKEEE